MYNSHGFKYMSYSIHTGTKMEHIKGMDNYPSKEAARLEFLRLISMWNSQAYGNIQYWAIEE